jgi:hypothetical protein
MCSSQAVLDNFGEAGTQRVLLSGLLTVCVSSSSKCHLACQLADDVPLDRPAAADIALSFTLLAQAVRLFALFCRCRVVKQCFQGYQSRGPQWRSAASATGSAS